MFASASSGSGGGNFLVPNGTFFVELLIFIVVLGIVAKFILPPIQKAMDDRESTVRVALTASDEGNAQASRLSSERREVLEQGRVEARAILERATSQVNEMYEEARANGQREQDRLVDQARIQLETERERLREESFVHLGDLVTQAASQVIGSSIDARKHRELIDEVVSSSRRETGV